MTVRRVFLTARESGEVIAELTAAITGPVTPVKRARGRIWSFEFSLPVFGHESLVALVRAGLGWREVQVWDRVNEQWQCRFRGPVLTRNLEDPNIKFGCKGVGHYFGRRIYRDAIFGAGGGLVNRFGNPQFDADLDGWDADGCYVNTSDFETGDRSIDVYGSLEQGVLVSAINNRSAEVCVAFRVKVPSAHVGDHDCVEIDVEGWLTESVPITAGTPRDQWTTLQATVEVPPHPAGRLVTGRVIGNSGPVTVDRASWQLLAPDDITEAVDAVEEYNNTPQPYGFDAIIGSTSYQLAVGHYTTGAAVNLSPNAINGRSVAELLELGERQGTYLDFHLAGYDPDAEEPDTEGLAVTLAQNPGRVWTAEELTLRNEPGEGVARTDRGNVASFDGDSYDVSDAVTDQYVTGDEGRVGQFSWDLFPDGLRLESITSGTAGVGSDELDYEAAIVASSGAAATVEVFVRDDALVLDEGDKVHVVITRGAASVGSVYRVDAVDKYLSVARLSLTEGGF